jgi:acyl-CoA dehydrogenase/citronellyl-CoA dehydrogenase
MTTWELDEDHEAFRQVCRRFVDDHVQPKVVPSEAAGTFPAELWPALGQAGLLGLLIPEEYGGSPADSLAITLLAEELARASGGLAITPLVSSYMAGPHIVRYGTADQKGRYLPDIAAGRSVVAIAVTEPGAGSDVAGISTVATPTEGGFVLRGAKTFITNAGLCDVMVVAAKTDRDAGHRGITTFLLDADQPGLSLGAPLPKMGWHSSDTREVFLDDCPVGEERVLGQVGSGFYQIMEGFQLERVLLAAMGVGLAAAALDDARVHAAQREAFGAPLTNLQTIRHRLAEMDVDLHLARLITYQSAARLDANHPDVAATVAMAKLVAARIANRVADEAVQIFGGAGFIDETPVARHYRDARILRIGGGTDEIQLEILAKQAPPR